MEIKFGSTLIPLSLDDVIYQIENFWKKDTIRKAYSKNNQFNILEIRRRFISKQNFSPEVYTINLGYNLVEKVTYVTIKVQLLNCTYLNWYSPKNIIKDWCKSLDIPKIKLSNIKDANYISIANQINIIINLMHTEDCIKFCLNCGTTRKSNEINCNYCGKLLVNEFKF